MILKISRVYLLFGVAALAILVTACVTVSTQTTIPAQTWYVDAARFHRSAHAGLDCTDCHVDIKMADVPAKHPDPEEIEQDARALFDFHTCDRCHPQEYAAYRTGVHAEVLDGTRETQSTFPAPTCGYCHSPHYDPPNRTRMELATMQVETCGVCHPTERDTYMENIHGKAAVNLGDTRSPACTDCHGGHQVVSLKKSEDALAVCQHCHAEATLNMAGFLIHAQESNSTTNARRANEFTLLFIAKIFFTLLIVGILGFFYAHTLMWFIRSMHKKMRG